MTRSPIRILHLSSRADLGGGPRHVLSLLKTLPPNFHQYVAAPEGAFFSAAFKEAAHGTFALPARKFSLPALLRLIFAIRRWRIDVLHSHGRGAGIFSRIAGLLTGRPVIHTHHGLYLERGNALKRAALVQLERWLNRLSRRIVFVSKSELEACRCAGAYDAQRSLIIPNGVTIPDQARSPRHAPKNELIAITRLEPEKGNDRLLVLAHELSKLTHRFHLRIIGEGPLREALETQCIQLGLAKHVAFLGGRDDVPGQLATADIYITCSHGEAHSLAMLEAMSFGLPVAASRVRGHVDMVVDGINGILFDNADASEAARSLHRLISDRAQIDSLGATARQMVIDNFSVAAMASRLTRLYEDVVERTAGKN